MSHELVIESNRAERQYWKDLWHYRELFFILTWRDVAVQYKQTVVGVLWAVLPLTLLAALVALGPGLVLCALNVAYRDFRIIVPFITQFGLYLSPVGFSSGIVPEKWRLLYECNPMVGVIDGFRWAVLGSIECPVRALAISVGCALVMLLCGIKVFRKTERTFADVI